MMRHLRLLGLISVAVLAIFAAPAVVTAQTPVQDQYQPTPDADTDPDDDDDGTGDADTTDQAPVAVQKADTNGKLPFTGGSVPLVVLIGLALLAAGLVGTAATRKRRSSGSL